VTDIVFVENPVIANGISVVVRLVFHQSETPVEAQIDALCNSLADELKPAVHINFIPFQTL
jgi:pyruvate-formate lyase-activating enzyme